MMNSAEDQLILSLIKDKTDLLEQVQSLKKESIEQARQRLIDVIQFEREKKFLQKEVDELKGQLKYYEKRCTVTNTPLGTPLRLPEPTTAYKPTKLEE